MTSCVVVALCGLPGAAVAATPLAQLVPDYMEGDLETAIIPTLQQAELKETAFGAGKVRIKMLYSKTRLYIAIEFRYQTKPALPHWAAALWRGKQPGEQVHFAWRVPCIEVFFDATGHRDHYYHIVSNVAGLWMATHSRAYEKEKTGGWWQPGWDFKFTLQDKSGVFEASIPLNDLTDDPPAKGTIWGFQAYRSKIGHFAMFSGCYDLVGGEPATRQFGRIVFQ